MKKALFCSLLLALLLLLATSAALAVSPSDFNCIKCGEPCTEWYASISNDGTTNNHSPLCRTCWAIVWYVHFPCTPVEGTATCIQADLCSVCGYPDNIKSAPNPNAHNMSEWGYRTSTQHFRYCQNCYAADTYEYEDHYGGTATCIAPAVCEGCDTSYGDLAADAHMWREWIPDASGTHYRTCSLTPEHIEYGVCSGDWFWVNDKEHGLVCSTCENRQVAEHTGGTATCIAPAVCEGCGEGYGELSTEHIMSKWEVASATPHKKYCTLCWAPESIIYEDHYGGTATCTEQAVCEVCSEGYGELSDKHLNMSDWFYTNAEQHLRYCRDCASPDSFEYEDHYGGDGSCRPTCEGCGQRHYDADGEHRSMSDWVPLDDTEHYRFCSDCSNSDSIEYEDHYGGTATCTQKAVCEGCNIIYGELSTEHPWSDWYWVSEEMHMRECPDCGASETADHQSDNGSCLPTCLDCEQTYLDPNGEHRNMISWHYKDTETHTRFCLDCGSYSETAPHTGGDGSCYPVCEVCYGEYPNPDGEHSLTDWIAITGEQHMRYCDRCGGEDTFEYGVHNGGTATCSDWAICDDCGLSYGDFARDVHLHMSEWAPRSDGHERFCLDCRLPTSFERAPHTDDGTCMSTCIDCGATYYDSDGEHHITDWLQYSDTQHFRYCDRCYGESTHEYANHVGDGTCTTQCKDCGDSFTDPEGTHSLTEWATYSNKEHVRYCQNCKLENTYEYDDHHASAKAEDLLCNESFSCVDCGMHMGWGTQHPMSEWLPFSAIQHMRYCTIGGIDHMVEYEDHQGDGSCTPVCITCGEQYLDAEGEHRHMSDWVDEGDNHTRFCTDCVLDISIESEAHVFLPATCVSPSRCETCGAERGEIDLTATGHDYRLDKEEHATCLETGLLTYLCQREGCPDPILEIFLESPGQHLYHSWEPLGGNRHIDRCVACDAYSIVPCTLFELDGFSVCPICGEYEGGLLPILYAQEQDVPLPYGTLIVRGGEIPVDGTLYAFTVAGSYGGYVVELNAPVTISIPMEADGFRLIGMDGGEISYTLEDGLLTTQTDAVGLFFLVPVN